MQRAEAASGLRKANLVSVSDLNQGIPHLMILLYHVLERREE